MAEQIKMNIGSAYPWTKPLTMSQGPQPHRGWPKTITIDDSEIREAIGECVATILNAIRVALERTPRSSAPISAIAVSSLPGCGMLKNLDKRIREEQDCPCRLQKILSPAWCSAPARC
jgi:rod shape-determining protein MreB